MPRSPAARASNLLSRFPCFYTIDSQPWVSKAASGTADVDFVPLFREEELDSTYNHWQQYQSIVFQAPYQDHSFEELRVADYARTTPGQSEPGCKGDAGASETKPAPTAAASILSLPEELVVEMTNHLQLKDLRAFRLANHKLAQASSYAIAQNMPLDKHIRLTETGLRSFLPVTRNREVARRISTLCVDGRFLVADTHGSGLEHECRSYPGLADCPVRIERDVVDGCSETHVRLLAEMFRNLQNLRRVELRGFPVSIGDGGDGDGSGQSFRAWGPMSSWPFRSVVAALRAGGTHVPELVVREAMYSEGVKAVLEPPPTEACPPSCELGAMPWLKSLDIGVMNVLDCECGGPFSP
ncbi:hypothetical protein SLS55_007644 [Diplodia seriata]|uniref:F-box domain-containing protein n=1 Tax=Diplodia seriata TaxID=420778 RepID=A0ABR3C8B1_9PEZI